MNTTYGVLNNSSLIIDTDKLRENVRTILRSLPAGTKLIPVVKDDAYGMEWSASRGRSAPFRRSAALPSPTSPRA